jgi:hypothetical protein
VIILYRTAIKRLTPHNQLKDELLDVQSRHLFDWVEIESFRLIYPSFADELVGCQPFEGLETACEVVGIDKVGEMPKQLVVTVIVVAMDSGLLDGAVHAFDLAIGPGMFDFGQPVINVVSGASTLECVTPEQLSFCPHFPDVCWRPAAASWISELNAVVGENCVDIVRNSSNEIVQELLRDGIGRLLMKLDISKLAGSVDCHEQMELAFSGSDFGNVDMKVANWISLELLLWSLIAFDVRQALDAMSLKAAMQ